MWQLNNYLDSRKCFIAFAIIVVISSVKCQNRPHVEPQHVEKNEGETVNVMCSFGKSISRCRFYSPSGQSFKLSQGTSRGKYEYYGSGFDNGQCGITINGLDKSDEGTWRCALEIDENSDDIEAEFTVTITKAPSKIELYVPEANNLREGIDMQAECTFVEGSPPAMIEWFFGNESAQSREPVYRENGKDLIATSIFQRTLRAEDNLKPLTCRISHPALQNGFQDSNHQLHVNFPPQALPRQELHITGLTIGSTAEIEVKIRSNPRPHLQWTIDGKILKEGEQNEKYVVSSPVQIEDGRFSVKLTVIQLTLEDTVKIYNLRAGNELGSLDYQIRIGGSPDERASGLGIVAIIGIVIASLVVLIIVALFVVARITKRWCFAGASMHPNSPDSEAQITPDEDKTHEQYEQHDSKVSDEESGVVEQTKASNGNGKSNGNTSV